jgi:SNF2 family DNA or RNA helicase
MKMKWAREIKRWTGKNSYIIYGEKEHNLPKSKFYIINYHILGRENKTDREEENQRKVNFKKAEHLREIQDKERGIIFKKNRYIGIPVRIEGWITELSKKNIIGIFPDEAHKLSNEKAIWVQAFIQLFNTLKPKIFVPLSGTLTRKRPRNLFTILHLTAPYLFPNRYKFLYKFCDPKKTRFGWTFDGSTNQEELHNLLLKVMIRRLKSEVLKELPPRTFTVIPLELTKLEAKNYSSLDKEYKLLINKQTLQAKNTYSELKLLAYLAKRNSCFNWIDEYLEDHDKLILAAWHKKVINDLYDKYKHIGLKIDGSVQSKKRLEIEDKFQTDEKIKVIILQIDAGGEGLTLTASNAIAIIEMPDTPGQLIQVSDRGHRIGLKSDTFTIYFPFADGTIENKIADEIENSSKSLEAILDGKKGSGLFKYQFKNL